MTRIIAFSVAILFSVLAVAVPASASTCTDTDTQSIRSLLVPITRLSAHQGRNVNEIKTVLMEIARITKTTKSTKLRKSLKLLEDVVREGELNPGSTDYWGYREGSAWKTYKIALTLTQKNRC